jgi:hypothetical protein
VQVMWEFSVEHANMERSRYFGGSTDMARGLVHLVTTLFCSRTTKRGRPVWSTQPISRTREWLQP